jgi:Na+/H+-translocating membrane pyrophosphatase
VQYRAVTTYALPLGIFILISYLFRPPLEGVSISRFGLGFIASICFYIGCGCSALSGYTSMYVASMTNIRVASAARRSYGEALIVCFRGGGILSRP